MLLEIFKALEYTHYEASPLPLAVPIVMGAISVGSQIYSGIIASNKANKAKTDAKLLQDQLTDLENSRQDIYNASQDIKDLAGQITNPYANLPVATQAAEMQAEQADLALANTLDSMQAGGFGSGGATALAQAAARSKRGISANIEQQEARNNQLKAQGEISVQNQKLSLEQAAIGAEQQAWQQQENRELMQLDRTQALIDNQMAQQMQYQADAMGAFTGAAGSLTGMATSLVGMPGVGTGGDITEQTNWTGQVPLAPMTPRAGGNINSGNYSRTAPMGTLPRSGGQINTNNTMPTLRKLPQ
jgi:outer membrane murein-binding lipoprotein Lpp